MNMNKNNMKWNDKLAILAVAGALAFAPAVSLWAQKPAGPDGQVQADVMKALDKKQFKDVQAEVANGVVTLTGTVSTYADKESADRLTHHRKNVSAVDNEIQISGPTVEDPVLLKKLAEKLEYDRVGYGTTAFNSITIGVQNGVVTLGGTVYGPVDKDSALALVANYPGVKDVVDNINVAPLSPNDDRIRIAEFRSIYGFPSLNKYAVDPGKPIRITVVNGHVTLTGVVDSQADKETANIRANGVPGVFQVVNDLQVANPQVSSR
jgi:osmotically-inducible protein OsmY